jgi:hypothetical protein
LSLNEKINLKNNIKNNYVFYLVLIIGISLSIKLFYVDFNLPLTLDSLGYFFYAYELQLTGEFSQDQSIKNNGWPLFLSIFFKLIESNELITYMQLQKIISIFISSFTAIPIYFLCRKFFSNSYSLVGAAIFVFEPRIIQNSLLGLTEPLYIFLTTTSILFFLSFNKKLIFISFVIVALVSIVRAEGIFLFFILSIMFFIKYRKDKLVIPKYFISLSAFILTLTPIIFLRLEILGNDAIVGRVISGIERSSNSNYSIISMGIENYIKFLGWDLIPIFIIFVPIGFFLILKKFDFNKVVIISSLISLSLPAIYAYSIPALDTRYLFILYPIFCVISLYTIKKFSENLKQQKIFLILLVICILIISIGFIEFKLLDTNHDKESFLIAQHIIENPSGINLSNPEIEYIEPAEIIKNWPEWKIYFFNEREKGESIRNVFPHEVSIISTDGYDNLKKFIEENQDRGLLRIISEDSENRPSFIRDIFVNEEKYPYLIKEFDSQEEYKIHMKIFKIDYDKFFAVNNFD